MIVLLFWLLHMPAGNEALVDTLAKLLHGENRQNISPEEAAAIVDTVFNRTQLQGYPSDPLEVIHQPKQYSPFNPDDPNFPVIQSFGPESPDWERYRQLAEFAVSPGRERSAFTHYFSGPPPSWAAGMDTQRIGAHTFGREDRRPKPRGE